MELWRIMVFTLNLTEVVEFIQLLNHFQRYEQMLGRAWSISCRFHWRPNMVIYVFVLHRRIFVTFWNSNWTTGGKSRALYEYLRGHELPVWSSRAWMALLCEVIRLLLCCNLAPCQWNTRETGRKKYSSTTHTGKRGNIWKSYLFRFNWNTMFNWDYSCNVMFITLYLSGLVMSFTFVHSPHSNGVRCCLCSVVNCDSLTEIHIFISVYLRPHLLRLLKWKL